MPKCFVFSFETFTQIAQKTNSVQLGQNNQFRLNCEFIKRFDATKIKGRIFGSREKLKNTFF